MSSEPRKILRIALAGNPNSGKTTLFNALTGAHHKVGNYPGVTVEKREGSRFRNGREYRFIDLPGIYSLTAYSMDEVVTRDFLLDERPDLIIDVLDSTNLERHLYLCLQFQELGIPVVGALNMSDEADAKGIRVDEKALSAILGVPMTKTVGTHGGGVDALLDLADMVADAVVDARDSGASTTGTGAESAGLFKLSAGTDGPRRSILYGAELEERLDPLEKVLSGDAAFCARFPARWLAVKLLEKDAHAYEALKSHSDCAAAERLAKDAVLWVERHHRKDAEIVVSEQRYGYIRGAVKEAVSIVRKPDFSVTEMIDKVIMNRFLALPIFVAVLWGVFQITFVLGEYPMALLESFFTWLGGGFQELIPAGFLRSLVVDGIIGGVGGVFSFVPLIVILFFLLSLLEDVGYMSRAAFATDKFLHSFGLHGQSIFPMMLGFGCSVPAIMAARTLKSPRDRIVTILVIPFMSCGAKLPIYVLLSAAFFPDHAANMVMSMYAIGVAMSLGSAFLLKKTILKGDPTPFVMELPPYRAPTVRGLMWHVGEKSWLYIKKAGTVILAASLLIWVVTTFPKYDPDTAERAEMAERIRIENPALDEAGLKARLGALHAERNLEYSIAGRLGRVIEPIFSPLGFDWKIGVAVLTGFAAKETVVSTLGVLYRVGQETDSADENLRSALRADPGLNPLKGFVLMLFMLLIPPCFAALATIRAELGSQWLIFAFVWLFGLGWGLSFLVYRVGMLAGW